MRPPGPRSLERRACATLAANTARIQRAARSQGGHPRQHARTMQPPDLGPWNAALAQRSLQIQREYSEPHAPGTDIPASMSARTMQPPELGPCNAALAQRSLQIQAKYSKPARVAIFSVSPIAVDLVRYSDRSTCYYQVKYRWQFFLPNEACLTRGTTVTSPGACSIGPPDATAHPRDPAATRARPEPSQIHDVKKRRAQAQHYRRSFISVARYGQGYFTIL
jgi:hypothetical protein